MVMKISLKNLTDEELVVVVREKDREAYEEVMKRYQNKLLRYAVYLVGNEDEASDVVQETFIKAFINLKGFDSKRKFSSWIYRICHNEAVNLLKKKKQYISLDANEWLKEKLGGRDNVEEEMEKKETKQMIRKGLLKLAVEYRSVLTLYFLEDKKYEEIAEVLRIPLGTVGIRMKRGKEKLKKICSNI